MRFFLLAPLLAFATAAPSHKSAKVALQVFEPVPAYRTLGKAVQQTLQPSSSTLTLTVGQALSLDHAPLRIHGIKIVEITEGKDLSTPARFVRLNDWRVVCKTKIGYGSKGWVFGVEDGIVGVSEAEAVDVTGVECWLEGGEDLIAGI